MNITPLTAAEVLRSHITFELSAIDRMYLNLYVPQLQLVPGAVAFFREHRGKSMVTMKMMSEMTVQFRQEIDRFASACDIPVVHFEKGQRKDDVMKQHLKSFKGTEGVVFIGVAQEKANVLRTIPRKASNGRTYPWVIKSSSFINHYYFYCVDRDFGPFFIKFCSYFPYTGKICINGHEYLKRQLERRGVEYESLDNGLLSCSDPAKAQEIADSFDHEKIERFAARWLRKLPNPFTESDQKAGYRYNLSMLQTELSLTQVLDRPSTDVFFSRMSSVKTSMRGAPRIFS